MSPLREPVEPFYVAGGTLPPGTPSYVVRRADTAFYERLLAGDFCYVLTARQMGKSSLMASTAKRLEEVVVRTAIVDLSQIGTERSATEANQWYFGIAHEIHRKLGIGEPLRPWWQERVDLPSVQKLTEFFRELVLSACPEKVVIFIDEIDSTIGLPFTDDFFAAIRACYNARATDPPFRRLTFGLLGVASPNQLIQDPARTPFNVGQRIDLTDFTSEEARPLAEGLHANPETANQQLERALYWSGGHPYLTQAICHAIAERREEAVSAEDLVDRVVHDLFFTVRSLREEKNLAHASSRLTVGGAQGRRLLRLYLRVCNGQAVVDEPASSLFAQLKLTGIVKVADGGNLAICNRIYETVFTPAWAKAEMPANRGSQLAAAILVAALIGLLSWYGIYYPRIYVQQIQAATQSGTYSVAANAYAKLHANPLSRSQSDELMARFWDHRGVREASLGHRDESLLSWLKAIEVKDTPRRRKEAQELVQDDYADLVQTFRIKDSLSDLRIDTFLNVFFDRNFSSVITIDEHGMRSWSPFNGEPAGHLEGIAPPGASYPPVNSFLSSNGKILTTLNLFEGIIRLDRQTGKAFDQIKVEPSVSFFPEGFNVSPSGKFAYFYFKRSRSDDGFELLNIESKRAKSSFADCIPLAFSTDDRFILVRIAGALQVRNRENNERMAPNLAIAPALGRGAAFSPDGRLIAIGDSEGTVRLWEWSTGRRFGSPLRHGAPLTSIALSPAGRTILTAGSDGVARLWEGHEAPFPKPSLPTRPGIVLRAGFAQDGRTILVLNPKGVVQRRSIETGSLIGPERRINDWDAVRGLLISSDGSSILLMTDKGVKLWSEQTGQLGPALGGENSLVTLSPDGQTVATFDKEGRAELWNARTGFRIGEKSLGLGGPVQFAKFSPDGQALLTGGVKGAMTLLGVTPSPRIRSRLHLDSEVEGVAFRSDGKQVVIVDVENRAHLFNSVSGKLESSFHLPGKERPIDVFFDPGGKHLFFVVGNWLNQFQLDEEVPHLTASRPLRGTWKAYRFPSECSDCLAAVLGYGDSYLVDTIHFDEPSGPPIEGNPGELLAHWQKVLALKFDQDMNIVPSWPLPQAEEDATRGR